MRFAPPGLVSYAIVAVHSPVVDGVVSGTNFREFHFYGLNRQNERTSDKSGLTEENIVQLAPPRVVSFEIAAVNSPVVSY